MGAARREPRGVKITMRAGKPLPVLYTPSQGKRGKYWYKTEIRVQDRTHGHSRVRLRPSLCREMCKGGTAVKLENFINYYYTQKALHFLLERGLLSETEYEAACRYNAEIFRPGRGYI